MTKTRWNDRDPRSLMEQLEREIRTGADPAGHSRGLFDRTSSPKIDVVEYADSFGVYCDLPGVGLEDLDVTVADNVLTLKGEKRAPATGDGQQVYRCETWTGAFQRTLSLPSTVDSAKIEATLTNGLLVVTLPKREEVKPRQVHVSVK